MQDRNIRGQKQQQLHSLQTPTLLRAVHDFGCAAVQEPPSDAEISEETSMEAQSQYQQSLALPTPTPTRAAHDDCNVLKLGLQLKT